MPKCLCCEEDYNEFDLTEGKCKKCLQRKADLLDQQRQVSEQYRIDLIIEDARKRTQKANQSTYEKTIDF